METVLILNAEARRIASAQTIADALSIGSLAAYWDQLNRHDWGFEWSDDPGVYRRAKANQDQLGAVAALTADHRAMFDAFRKHHDAHNYGREIVPPLPQRPER